MTTTGFADERTAIEARLQGNFSAIPVRYENVPFTQPKASPWASLEILSGQQVARSLGTEAPLRRWAGVIQVTVHVPEDTGTAVLRQHADTIAAIFQDATFSAGQSGTIIGRTAYFTPLGVKDGWQRGVVSIPYLRTKIG